MILDINLKIFRLSTKKLITPGACVNCMRYKSSGETRNKAYSHTILFPKTNFPARSSCAQEDDIQKKARFSELYNWQRQHLKGTEFVLHDGPPYANGDLHMGHAVNKIIKDICNRNQVLQGNRVHYVPGWDCHGLPIELKALQKANKFNKNETTDPVNIRQIARNFALETVEKQKASFISWGIMADWEKQYYLTLNNSYIQNQLRKFCELYEKGMIYRALKPVYWSPSSRTALAEAELEYDLQYKSKEVYISFPIETPPDVLQNVLAGKKLHAIIWTTTPWSLVANRAICYNSKLKYSVITMGNKPKDDLFIVGSSLIASLEKACNVETKKIAEFDGVQLKNTTYRNKLLGCTYPFLSADHVTDGKGTGLVHTAPAHGPDDFLVALKNNIAVDCNVDEEGRYKNLNQSLNGLPVLTEGQDAVIDQLAEDIIHQGIFVHSYPLDWRTKKPVVIRASHQWFIDTEQLKKEALECASTIPLLPAWGAAQHRLGLSGLLARRAYWCISRQRAWGVPIPALYCNGQPFVDRRVIDHLCILLETRGPDVWWTSDVKELVPEEVLEEKKNDIKEITKGNDIMDIWLDSGLSWGILDGRKADLYAEGVDQLTGWFQASLLTSLPLAGVPYRSIFVHGFVVDDKKRKMSKSIGNVIDPTTIIHGGKNKTTQPAYGVDTLRWWVASHSTQHSQIVISKKLLDDCHTEITRIRNIMKYILGVLSDLQKDDFDHRPLLNYLDEYMVKECYDFINNITDSYNEYRYNSVAQTILFFISNKVSALYCHCVKDRLYCAAKDSNERISAQLVLNTILTSLCKGLGPILPHLVEEVWQHHPLYEKPFFFSENLPMLPLKEIDYSLMDTIMDIKKDAGVLAKNDNIRKYNAKIKLGDDLFDKFNIFNTTDGLYDSVFCELLEVSSVSLELAGDLGDKKWNIELLLSDKEQCLRCRKYNALDCSDKCLRCENVVMGIL